MCFVKRCRDWWLQLDSSSSRICLVVLSTRERGHPSAGLLFEWQSKKIGIIYLDGNAHWTQKVSFPLSACGRWTLKATGTRSNPKFFVGQAEETCGSWIPLASMDQVHWGFTQGCCTINQKALGGPTHIVRIFDLRSYIAKHYWTRSEPSAALLCWWMCVLICTDGIVTHPHGFRIPSTWPTWSTTWKPSSRTRKASDLRWKAVRRWEDAVGPQHPKGEHVEVGVAVAFKSWWKR